MAGVASAGRSRWTPSGARALPCRPHAKTGNSSALARRFSRVSQVRCSGRKRESQNRVAPPRPARNTGRDALASRVIAPRKTPRPGAALQKLSRAPVRLVDAPGHAPSESRRDPGHGTDMGAALLRRRPNQSLRQRGRRQLDPSRRGEGAAEGTGGRWYLCRQRRLGVFRWYSRAWWRVSVRINAPAARGGLRTVATAAKCHRAPVDYHPVAGQMPTGLQ